MNKVHSIKVEPESTSRKFSCSLCNYSTSNMNEFKNHLIVAHKKESHTWMVEEINIVFKCDECDLEFPRKSLLEGHMDQYHSGDQEIIPEIYAEKDEIVLSEDKAEEIDETPQSSFSFPCDCNICGELLRDKLHSLNHMKEHFGKVNIEKKELKEPFKFEVHNGESDSDSEDDDIPPPKFVKHGWGDNFPEIPTGINFKAKTTLFHHAADKVKIMFKKGSKGQKNGVKFSVTGVERKGGGSSATVNIVDENGQNGNVQLRTWAVNKKTKECTIQVDKVKAEEVRFVKIFAEEFVMYALEEVMQGNNVKHIFKDQTELVSLNVEPPRYKCDTCEKTFKEVRTLKMQVTRMHTAMMIKQVQIRKSKPRIRCEHCKLPFTEDNLKKHLDVVHNCTFCATVSKTELEKKRHMRDRHDRTTMSTSPKNKKRKEMDSLGKQDQEVASFQVEETSPGQGNVSGASSLSGHQGEGQATGQQVPLRASTQVTGQAPEPASLPGASSMDGDQTPGLQGQARDSSLLIPQAPGLQEKAGYPHLAGDETTGLQGQAGAPSLGQGLTKSLDEVKIQSEVNKLNNEKEEMFLADEARWENMSKEPLSLQNKPENESSELKEKYQRLVNAKEASDVRLLELHDKNAELATINSKQADQIINLTNELKLAKKNEVPEEVVNNDDNTKELEVLRKQKDQGHSRTSPGSQPQPKKALESYNCKVCKTRCAEDSHDNSPNSM